MNFVFLTDPLEYIHIRKDTGFILMLGAHQREHQIYYLPKGGLTLKNNKVFFRVQKVIPQKNDEMPFIDKGKFILSQDEVDAVFIRTDPPFDEDYLVNTWLLDRLPQTIPVVNHPTGIRTVNEKIWVTRFPHLIPPTVVTRNKEDFLEFLSRERDIILKPINGHGGKSVFHVQEGDSNANVAFETLNQAGQKEVILQKYISDAEKGDKRILLLDGDPLGAVLRVHPEGDHRNNFYSGGRPEPATVTRRDEEIIKTLKPELKKLNLALVGIDIIGEYLIEVNVTSPTCMQEINQIDNKQLENDVIEYVEKIVRENSKAEALNPKEILNNGKS